MRKILVVSLITLFFLSLVACGKREKKAEFVTPIKGAREAAIAPAKEPEVEIPKETVASNDEVAATDQEAGSAYTFTDISETKYAKSKINVRDVPDTIGELLGQLEKGEEIAVNGQCNETGWYRFDYKGQTAYVSNDYVVSELEDDAQPGDDAQPEGDDLETVEVMLPPPAVTGAE